MKVLIAEDDKFLANAYNLKLVKEGYDVQIAADGQEALDKLEQFNPDVILLDIIMPKLDGFMVLKQIRSQEKWNNLPVLITSNLGQKEDIEKGKELGATDFIIKSNSSLGDIIEKIKNATSQ